MLYGCISSIPEKKIAPDNDHNLLLKLLSKYKALENKMSLMNENTQLQFNEIKKEIPIIKDFLKSNHYVQKEPTHITIFV